MFTPHSLVVLPYPKQWKNPFPGGFLEGPFPGGTLYRTVTLSKKGAIPGGTPESTMKHPRGAIPGGPLTPT